MPKINFALGSAPEKAIEWLKTKQVTAENYRNLTDSEIAKVYTIARMTDLDMLNDIKQSMVKAASDGQSFADWNKGILQHLQNKGWLHPNGHDGKVIIDPTSGEVFGAPRRLENIYRTNMQTAYNAGQYQGYMANIDSRPYWMYDAVGDHRTRPAHAAMDGLVYRYDDPFWATFYPPNGYRCRCSVIALSERDMQREGKVLSQSGEHNLVETHKVYNKKGDSYPTIAYKAPDGSLYTTDRGFGYNAGRMNYRPNLDQYDRALAHEFAKAEMGGAEFKAVFKQLSEEFYAVKGRLKIDGKPDNAEKIDIRNKLSRQVKFAAGVLSKEVQQRTGLKRATVWLSDDTLIKQVDSREGQGFAEDYYAFLPEFLANPDHIIRDGRELIFTTQRNQEYLWAVLKYIDDVEEVYLQSYRISNEKEIRKLMEKKEVLK
ncbi:phage head morphogenesis protein [Neisseria sp. N95_16]|uniref:Phage head morphogenesis protein n=1 Tax=Neisseria brasiliensis TaxID=2666100 RepID=A0A5Q3S275_9NEIS|nr:MULTISPECIES: phage minor head protein [Neisseria]MRN38941.1 phage head morphogenesis protein [Neisseria brasiliensis]MRN39401.1 phage head morphogenesis protein [Neisseria brasiliensis]PJO08854.1 phage head morphogenesis protein [Neisseria sp. N95_16]PJO78424.1 phage head morphogenesis protein [Neisseria sp. N177_16]QGL26082.1 phage head morphogenesis protein [Neisseria brasiliensis]